MLAGETAVEIWPVSQEGEAVRTLVQALYGGFLTDGGALLPDEQALLEGMEWVGALTEAGMIGYADSRQAALERFAAGETAIFLDWSQREEALCAQLQEEMEYVLLPYPSSTGLPVRSWELTGVCVFGGEEEKTRLAMEAAAYLGGRAHTSGGALWADASLKTPADSNR